MDVKEREIIQKNKKNELENCFEYIAKNFTSWDYSLDDPWYKEIQYKEDTKNEKKENQFTWNDEEILPEEQGVYLFNSRTIFEHPYGKSGIYYIGKADIGLKRRLMPKLRQDYNSKYDGKKYGKKDRYFNFNENVNHYYPYLNYYQVFQTKIHYKIIDKDKKYLIPYLEEILISAFFTKMGNRPPSNRTGPNQLIWTDSENSKELITIYDDLLSSKVLD